MQQIVSITSQGQITIPAFIRRLLELDKYNKASVRADNKRVIVEPLPDLLSLGGMLRSKAIKGKTIGGIISREEKMVARTIARKHSIKKK